MRAVAACLAIAILLPSSSGCRMLSGGGLFRRTPPCTFQPDATKQEIVAHVNRFSAPDGERPALSGWRATSARLSFNGMPGIPANISIEAPSRIRIRATMFATNSGIADIGCNEKLIWVWHQMDPKRTVTIRHEDVGTALQQLQMPFDPAWMMEIVGVAPMNVEDFQLRHPDDPNEKWVDLVAQRIAPSGEPVQRVIRVNLCYGQIVEHRIEHADGSLIASAKLSNYSPDASGQFMMPHLVQIDWPEQKQSLRLELGPIYANPTPLADADWEVPQIRGAERFELRPPTRTADPRDNLTEPLQRKAFADPGTRMDVSPDSQSAVGQPAGYFPAASQSSSDPLLPEQESGPRPFPPQP